MNKVSLGWLERVSRPDDQKLCLYLVDGWTEDKSLTTKTMPVFCTETRQSRYNQMKGS